MWILLLCVVVLFLILTLPRKWLRILGLYIGVLIGTVCLWRGLWGLMDEWLRPDDLVRSYLYSIVIGVLVVALTALFSPSTLDV